jgi:hypothetical protein
MSRERTQVWTRDNVIRYLPSSRRSCAQTDGSRAGALSAWAAQVRLVAVLGACALALPCAAAAEPVVSLGRTDGAPKAVTDGAGTLHVVWRTHKDSVLGPATPRGTSPRHA